MEDPESKSLERFFKNIIDGKKVEADTATLNVIIEENFGINFNSIKPKLKFILPYMLVHFIKVWPGWKRTTQYLQKQITFKDWYSKFKEYLTYKLNYMIKNDYEKALAMIRYNSTVLEERVATKSDISTQTINHIEKVTAPFSIEITGPPKVLNALIFCEGDDDSVYVREYKVPTVWEDPLNIRQLTNWPFIEVDFHSEYLHFKRTNKHDFRRCLTFSSEKILFRKSDCFIEEINIIDENIARKAYTLNAVKEYCKAYISTLEERNDILNWSEMDLNEVKVILEDFILDIVAINMNSMATNTSVLFNIGNCVYARNKSIKTSEHAICFGECITPKLLLSLHAFTAIKDANMTSFDSLFVNNDTLLPTITYRCTYCSVSYTKSSHLWNHLKIAHIMEQPVLCFKCKLQFKITHLTDNRWYHPCSKTSKKTNDGTGPSNSSN